MKYWFTSDYHFGHANIIEYCNRPFKNLEDMNQAIIRNHNARVNKEDVVFHIGDFCFKNTNNTRGEGDTYKAAYYEKFLNGKIIHVAGNHDHHNSDENIIHGISICYGGMDMWLTHEPKNFSDEFQLNLVGHVHQNWKVKRAGDIILLNVGIDVNRFMPISIQEILAEYTKAKKNFDKLEEFYDDFDLGAVAAIKGEVKK